MPQMHGDGDLGSYSTSAFAEREHNQHNHSHEQSDEDEAPKTCLQTFIFFIKTISNTIFNYLSSTVDTFPVISFWLTWIFITFGFLSIITRWFIPSFYYSIFRPATWVSFFSILMPISIPFNWLGAAVMAFHGGRIEECRGSSYLLTFIILITIFTKSTISIIRIFTVVNLPQDDGDDGTVIVLTWLQRNYQLFDSYGCDFLPFSLVMLHGFITKHPYISLFGFPLRIHMIPGLLFIGLAYSLTHGGHISLSIPIAIGITWLFKYMWLSRRYTTLTGLLFTPLLCQLGAPLQKFIPWEYKPYQPQGVGSGGVNPNGFNTANTGHVQANSQNGSYGGISQKELERRLEHQNGLAQMSQVESMWEQTENSSSRYVVSLRTSEQYGELQGTEALLSRPLSTQSSPLSFLTTLPTVNGLNEYHNHNNYSNNSNNSNNNNDFASSTTTSIGSTSSTTPLRSTTLSYSSSTKLSDSGPNVDIDGLGQDDLKINNHNNHNNNNHNNNDNNNNHDPNFDILNSPSHNNIPPNQRRYGNGPDQYPQRTPSNSSEDLGMLTVTDGGNNNNNNNNNNSNNNNNTHNLSRSSSLSTLSTLSTNRYNENSALLVESPDQTCFECECIEFMGHGDNGKKCLQHLKFKSLIFKHTKGEYAPYQVEYITVRDKEHYCV